MNHTKITCEKKGSQTKFGYEVKNACATCEKSTFENKSIDWSAKIIHENKNTFLTRGNK